MNQWTNERGNEVTTNFLPGDRYLYDFKICTPEKGWEQFDTDQDAPYFGCWINKIKRQIVTYCEGDVSLVECPTVESFNAEIQSMCEFYNEGIVAITYDDNGKTIYRQDRQEFLIKENCPWV